MLINSPSINLIKWTKFYQTPALPKYQEQTASLLHQPVQRLHWTFPSAVQHVFPFLTFKFKALSLLPPTLTVAAHTVVISASQQNAKS